MLIHVSKGNVPSKWANSIQTMKMAEAFSNAASDYRLVIAAPESGDASARPSLKDWYGLASEPPVERLPLKSAPADGVFDKESPEGFAEEVERYLAKTPAAAVYTRCPKVARRSARLGIPTFLETHSIVHEKNIHSLAKLAEEPYLMGLVTLTQAHREQFAAIGFDPETILVWPDAVAPEQFDPSPPSDAEIRAAGGYPARPLVVYAGHLYRDRGIAFIIEAARRLQGADFLLVGGWDEDVARVRDEARDLPNVALTGFVAHARVPAYLKAASLLVMPYDDDVSRQGLRSSLKMFEYMAARRAIVGPDLASVSAVLEHEQTALLYPDGDGDAFIACIERLIESDGLRDRLASNAFAAVGAYTWERRARDILDFVQRRSQAEPPPRYARYYRSRIAIFGAGTRGLEACRELERNCEIVGFLDNFASAEKSSFAGRPVLRPDQLETLAPDYIILASERESQMRAQLHSMKWAPSRIGCFDGARQAPSGSKQ